MKKTIAALIALVMMLTGAFSALAPGEENDPKTQEAEEVMAWLVKDLNEDDFEQILSRDKESILKMLEGYDGELKYNTMEEIADELVTSLGMFRLLSGFAESGNGGEAITSLLSTLLGGADLFDFSGTATDIVPIFDGTKWESDDKQLEINYDNGAYNAVVTDEDVETSYVCECDEFEENDIQYERLTSTDEHPVTFVWDIENDTITMTDAEGNETVFNQIQEDDGTYSIEGVFDETFWKSGDVQLKAEFNEGLYYITVTDGETETVYECEFDDYNEGDDYYQRLSAESGDTFVVDREAALTWTKPDGSQIVFEQIIDELSMDSWYLDGKELTLNWQGGNSYELIINDWTESLSWIYQCELNEDALVGTGEKTQYGDPIYDGASATFTFSEGRALLTWTDDKEDAAKEGLAFEIIEPAFTRASWYNENVDEFVGFFMNGRYMIDVYMGDKEYSYACTYDRAAGVLSAADPDTLNKDELSDPENYTSTATFTLQDEDHLLWVDNSGASGENGIVFERAK